MRQAADVNASRVLRRLAHGADVEAIATVATHCSVDHVATLVFPTAVTDVSARLADRQWRPSPPIPSTVVRARLAHRYHLHEHLLEVSIVRATTRDAVGVEVFCLQSTAATRPISGRERREYHERHIALTVEDPSEGLLDELWCLFTTKLSMKPESGGHNPHENSTAGGQSVLYFQHVSGHRLELTYTGTFTAALGRHLDRSQEPMLR